MSAEVSMPIQVPPLAIPQEEDEADCAFKILNQDNLPMNIVGESLLKPFGASQKLKPNGIVLPQRRVTTNLEQKNFTKSNGAINITNERNAINNLKKNLSTSHGHLNHCNSSVKIRIEDLQNHGLDKNFTRNLDAKLRKLQRETNISPPVKKTDISAKPRFVTTVKKGEFLEPPPELANLLGLSSYEENKKEEKKLYAYASQPRILDRSVVKNGHKARCEAAAKAAEAAIEEEVIITKRDVNANMIQKKFR